MAKFMIYGETEGEKQLFLQLRRKPDGGGVTLRIVDKNGTPMAYILAISKNGLGRAENIPESCAEIVGFPVDEKGRIKEI